MKNILTLVSFLLFAFIGFSQTQRALDKALSEITSDLSEKLKAVDKKKIVVLYVTDIDKQMTLGGKYIADVVSVDLVNNPGKFLVFDRSNLNEIAEAKKLYAEGYIDAVKAQELRRLLGVDAIVIGTYTVLSNTITLTLKGLDSENGFVIAASMRDLPLDADAARILDIPIVLNDPSNPVSNSASGEVNGRASKNPNCKEKNTGDYCFQNNTKFELNVQLYNNSSSNRIYYNQFISVQPGQRQYFYDLPVGSYSYSILKKANPNTGGTYNGYTGSGSDNEKPYSAQGNAYVERCQEKQFIIR